MKSVKFPAASGRPAIVMRTTNDIAAELVGANKAVYSTKGAWKKHGRVYLEVVKVPGAPAKYVNSVC